MRKLLIIIAILLISVNAWGTDYYVDADAAGGGGCGAIGTPCKTIAEALACSAAGDTVYFDSTDTWTGTGNINSIFAPEGGVAYIGNEWPTPDSDCSDGGCAKIEYTDASNQVYRAIINLLLDDGTYDTVIEGFEVDGNAYNVPYGIGVGTYSSMAADMIAGGDDSWTTSIIIRENWVHHMDADTYSYGIGLVPDNSHTISNVEVLYNTVNATGSDAIAIYPQGGETANLLKYIIVRGNDSSDGGLYTGDSVGCAMIIKNDVRYATIEYNYLHDTDNPVLSINTTGATFNMPTEIDFRYNVLEGSATRGITISGSYANDFIHRIYGNIIYGNADYGFYIYTLTGDASTINVYDNTFYNNVDYEFVVTGDPGTLNFSNNILSAAAGTKPCSDTSDYIDTHVSNIYFRSGGGDLVTDGSATYTSADLTDYEATARSSDPLFTNAAGGDFTLLPGSPARHGADVTIDTIRLQPTTTFGVGANGLTMEDVTIGAYGVYRAAAGM